MNSSQNVLLVYLTEFFFVNRSHFRGFYYQKRLRSLPLVVVLTLEVDGLPIVPRSLQLFLHEELVLLLGHNRMRILSVSCWSPGSHMRLQAEQRPCIK
jgi:hypothetical protein